MSAVKGKVRENQEFTKETGFFEGKVVAINPSKQELEKLLKRDLENDTEYVGSEILPAHLGSKEVKKSQVVFWVEDVTTGKLRDIRFFLKDMDRVTSPAKEGEAPKVEKKQYINSVGVTTWSDSEDNLPDWFKERSYRVAKSGEEELYGFVVAWLNKLDRKDPDTLLSFDFKKLINGDVRELKAQMGCEYEGTIAPLVIVREVKKEGEEKKYFEQVYSKNVLPGFAMKQVRAAKIDSEFIQKAKNADRKKRSVLQRFVLDITDNQYGIKDFFSLGELEAFDPSKHPIASGKTLVEDDTSY